MPRDLAARIAELGAGICRCDVCGEPLAISEYGRLQPCPCRVPVTQPIAAPLRYLPPERPIDPLE